MTVEGKRATPTRKPAAKRTPKTSTNGAAKAATNGAAADNVEAPEPTLNHPYGNKKLYVYHPKDGSAPIIFPHITEVKPTQKFFWKIYKMNSLFQSFEWMLSANIPRDIQERVMDLGETNVYEQADFFRGWFAPIASPQEGLSPPGES